MAENTSQMYPTLAFNSKKKEYLLVWMSGKEIVATRINSNAFPKDYDDEFRLVTMSPLAKVSEPMKMSLTYCEPYDEYLLIWSDKVTQPGDYAEGSASKTFNLQALVLNGDDVGKKAALMVGEKEGTTQPGTAAVFESAVAEMFSQHDQTAPTAAYCPVRDEYLVVWCDQEKGAQKYLHGLRIRADDKKPVDTVPIRLVPDETNQESPSLVWSDQQGEYMLVWGDDGEGLNVRGERISRDGQPHGGGSFDIVPERRERKRNQTEPSLAYNPVDGFHFVTWIDRTNGGEALIKGRRLNENGFPIVGLIQDRPFLVPVISRRLSSKRCPVVGADSRRVFGRQQSDFVVLWSDDQNHPGTYEIWGHRLNSNGHPFATPNFVVVRADVERTDTTSEPQVPEGPLEAGTVRLTPIKGTAGYVVSTHPDQSYLDGQIFAGFFWGRLYHGMMQFDLSAIPAGSRIFSARLEMRGWSRRYMDKWKQGGLWSVRMLHPAFDTAWKSHTYETIHNAAAAHTLTPTCRNQDLAANKTNVFTLGQSALSDLEKRLSRGVVSFRVDGPTQYTNLFLWDSPVLSITYAKPVGVSQPSRDRVLININTASAAELQTLPGIGPSFAQRIVDYRTANGPFARIEDIQNVRGIGQATFDRIKDLITV